MINSLSLSSFSSRFPRSSQLAVASLLVLFGCKTTKQLPELPLSNHIHPNQCTIQINTTGDSLQTLFLAYNPETRGMDTFTNMNQVHGCLGIVNPPDCDCLQEQLDGLSRNDVEYILDCPIMTGRLAYNLRSGNGFTFVNTQVYPDLFDLPSQFPEEADSTQEVFVYAYNGVDNSPADSCTTNMYARYLGFKEFPTDYGFLHAMLEQYSLSEELTYEVLNLRSAIQYGYLPDGLSKQIEQSLPASLSEEEHIVEYNNALGDNLLLKRDSLSWVLPYRMKEYGEVLQAYSTGCPASLDYFSASGHDAEDGLRRLEYGISTLNELSRLYLENTPGIDSVDTPTSCFTTTKNSNFSFTIDANCDGVSFFVSVYTSSGSYIGDVFVEGNQFSVQNTLVSYPSGVYYVRVQALPSGETQVIKVIK